MKTKRILVTGAGGSAAYNFIESIRHNPKKEKVHIVGVDTSPHHIELSNVDGRYLVPPVSDKTYIKKLNEIIKREKIDFVHPQPDVEVDFLAKNYKKIEAKTFLPSYKTVELCQNKMEFNRVLKENSIAVPEAYYLNTEKDLAIALKQLFKSHEKVWLRAIRGAGSKAALPVKNIEHARMWIDYWKVMKGLGYGDFMVSEFLPGKEYAFQSVWHEGKLITSQARERLQYIFGNLTPSGQSSSPSLAKTVHNQEVNDLVYKAILAIDKKPSGVFCADLKTDKDGQVKMLEINIGRFFTTSYFFSKAGSNMPYYYLKLGFGEKIPANLSQFNSVPADYYWVRMIDMGYKLVKGEKWTSQEI